RNRQVAAAVHRAVVLVLRRRLLEPVSLLDLEREGRQPARQRLRPARALERIAPPRVARSGRRRALLALLDALRGLPDDPRPPGARGGVAGPGGAAADSRRDPLTTRRHCTPR